MKDLFGPEGLLCVSIGSWVGTVLLYLLPIESEMRLRIMRQAAWSCGFAQHGGRFRDRDRDRGQNHNDSIQRVMFQPGGVWMLKSFLCGEMDVHSNMGMDLDMDDSKERDDRKDEGIALAVPVKTNSSLENTSMNMNMNANANANANSMDSGIGSDMVWDHDGDDSDGNDGDDENSDEGTESESHTDITSQLDSSQEHSSLDTIGSSEPESLVIAAAATATASSNVTKSSMKTDSRKMRGIHKLSSDGAVADNGSGHGCGRASANNASANDSPEQIVIDIFRQMSKVALEHLGLNLPVNIHVHDHKKHIQNASVAAAVMLMVQMKYSRTARRAIWTMFQGSAALSLVCVAFGAQLYECCSPMIMGMEMGHPMQSPSPLQSHPWNVFGRSTSVGTNGYSHLKYLLRRFQADDKLKKKLQGLAAVAILLYFRNRNGRRIRFRS